MNTRELIEKYGIRANKNLGQNFLHREDIIEDIAVAATGTPLALEIGAGLGVLSARLCQSFEKVTTVEIDRSLSEVTAFTLKDCQNHRLIYQDFLKTDIAALKNEMGEKALTVVGNLPYNITGKIITKLLKNHAFIEKAVVMIQKEAAQKLVAKPSEEGYRAISVLTRYFCDVETVCDVSPDSFIPPPHVTSRVIKLTFKKELSVPPDMEKEFFLFVHNLFSKRRKLMTASFSKEQKPQVLEILENMGLDPQVRAEQLSPDKLAEFFVLMFCK